MTKGSDLALHLAYCCITRALRIEFDSAWYYVMNRDAWRRDVFASDEQRERFLELLGQMVYGGIAEALRMNPYSAAAFSIRRLKILRQENTHIRRLEKEIRQEMALKQTWPLCFLLFGLQRVVPE